METTRSSGWPKTRRLIRLISLAAEPAVAARACLRLERAEDDVVARHRLVDEQQRLVGRVLQVVVHGDDVVAGRLAHAGEVGVVLAVVAQQVERDDVGDRARPSRR